jgi:hypothetical protein
MNKLTLRKLRLIINEEYNKIARTRLNEADPRAEAPAAVSANDVKKAMYDEVAKWNPDYAKNNLPGAFQRRVRSSQGVCELIGKGSKPTFDDAAAYIAIQLSKKDGGFMQLVDRQLDVAPVPDVNSAALDEKIYNLAMRGIYEKYPHAASSSHAH